MGPSEVGSEGLEEPRSRQKLVLNGFRKTLKLRVKGFIKNDDPTRI